MECIEWLESMHTLHGKVEILYVVSGYQIQRTFDDSDIGEPIIEKTLSDCIRRAIAENWTPLTMENIDESALAAKNEGWINWNGGGCPVDNDALVDVKFSDSVVSDIAYRAGNYRWTHKNNRDDIIAYRLHKPEVKAVEWNGEGLPPVGVECEFKWLNDSWRIGKLCYLSKHTALISSSHEEDDGEFAYSASEVAFRPILTESERNREIIEGWFVSIMPESEIAGVAEKYLYEAIAAGKIPGVKLED